MSSCLPTLAKACADLWRHQATDLVSADVGNVAVNIEQAVALYQRSLELVSQEQEPVEWARTSFQLALVYELRVCGDPETNNATAHMLLEQALSVFDAAHYPVDRAHVLHALVRVALPRALSNEGAALAHLNKLLGQSEQVLTHAAFPIAWAEIQLTAATVALAWQGSERVQRLREAQAGIIAAQQIYECMGARRSDEHARSLLVSIKEALTAASF